MSRELPAPTQADRLEPDGWPASAEDTIRVLVADDDPLALRLICQQLSAPDVEVVGRAVDGDQAVDLALELLPDVIVMDLLMPGADGITAARRITERAPHVQIVILSVSEDDDLVLHALRAGVVGFLNKAIDMDALLRVVRGVSRGEAALDRTTTRRLIAAFRATAPPGPFRPEGRSQSAGSELSPREAQILGMLAAGLRTEAVAEELGLATETVRTHVKAVLRKLRAHTRQEAIGVARARGILPSPGGGWEAL